MPIDVSFVENGVNNLCLFFFFLNKSKDSKLALSFERNVLILKIVRLRIWAVQFALLVCQSHQAPEDGCD